MNKKTICVLLYVVVVLNTYGQPFASWTKTQLQLDNGMVQRSIQLPASYGNFMTTEYKPMEGEFSYFEKKSTEFQFSCNSINYSGKGKWTLLEIMRITDQKSGDGAAVKLVSEDKKVELSVNYLLYPGSPVIRKNLVIKNLTTQSFALESVDVEKFDVVKYAPSTFSWIYSDYGRRKSIGPYEGNMQDALMMLYNPDWQQGMVIGNEAPGVMKRTSIFWEGQDICVGLTHKNALYPFRKWLKPGESFETPQVFTLLYNHQKNPDQLFNIALPNFVRKHMGIRLSGLADKPTFVYNTWHPFKGNINEKLIMELAAAAAAAGMKEFVIDDGWQDVYGDWGINKNKFPNGLKPVFDYIKSLGMKPGIWISVGTAAPESKVFKEHPEWFVKNKTGKNYSLVIEDKDKYTACFGTGWNQYIKGILKKMVLEYGLEYLKLDFSIVTSPYRYNHEESGCYAGNHPGHKDHAESLFTNYEYMWSMFDELHKAKPELFIDCTFETMGGLQLIDYAMLKHAEGNWLSNFYAPDEDGDLRIRNMAWWRSPAMSATALVIGNQQMQDTGWEMHIKSLAGALPIMLGDPRQLSEKDRLNYKRYSQWLQSMQTKYDFMSFRQDLPGFGEPAEGMWDGFQRINTDSKTGGIIAVFRHAATEKKRIVTVNYLDPLKTYSVKTTHGQEIAQLTGMQLQETGFEIFITDKYGGVLLEISEK